MVLTYMLNYMADSIKQDKEFYAEMLKLFLDSANDAIFVLCDEMKFLICNRVTEIWLNEKEDNLTRHNQRIPITSLFFEHGSIDLFRNKFEQALKGVPQVFECLITPVKGENRWVEFSMKKVSVDEADMIITVGRDISEKKQIEDDYLFQSMHDNLTGLYNRKTLKEFLDSELDPSSLTAGNVAIILIDINRFRIFNEVLGHEVGDKILLYVADLLRYRYRDESLVMARYGSNEFVVVVNYRKMEELVIFIEKLFIYFNKPLNLEIPSSSREEEREKKTMPVSLDITVGVSIYPEDGLEADDITQKAEIALKTAKKGKAAYAFYKKGNEFHSMHKLSLMADFKTALESEQFEMYFQPKVQVKDNKVVGAEILSRWNHPKFGLILPDSYLPIAEEMNLFRSFSRMIIRKSFLHIRELLIEFNLHFAINISPYNLLESDFVSFIEELLESNSISPGHITLEITESAMMIDKDLTNKVINQLALLGLTLSVDDFGTGYSSLSYLNSLPVHELKIDRSFITDINTNFNNSVIVKSIITMAQNLGMYVTAEGIETAEEYQKLKEFGCNISQGFLFAKPMSFGDFKQWLAKFRKKNTA